MQGYLALGLIIGIAGLGVVMVRAVRERRRQIGMLRAMGFQSRVVRQAFLVEAGFIAVQGIALGVILALVTSLPPADPQRHVRRSVDRLRHPVGRHRARHRRRPRRLPNRERHPRQPSRQNQTRRRVAHRGLALFGTRSFAVGSRGSPGELEGRSSSFARSPALPARSKRLRPAGPSVERAERSLLGRAE